MIMNWADWVIVTVIGISSLISIKRGFVNEAISLAVWGLAFFVAVAFHERLAVLLQPFIDVASLRYMVAFGALLVATLIIGSMIKYLLGELVKVTGLSGSDRILGTAFGLSRGVIVVMAILILLPMAFPVEQDSWWQESSLIPQFLLIEQWCKDTFTLIVDFVVGII